MKKIILLFVVFSLSISTKISYAEDDEANHIIKAKNDTNILQSL